MGFEGREVLGRRYQLFTPRAYDSSRPWPLVVFLHGVGENGVDGEKQLAYGLPPALRELPEFPAFVLVPQCKGPWKWVGEDESVLLAALDATLREARIDEGRVYLTGLSQGGCSTFDLGAKFPDRWAALGVVCGAGYAEDAARIKAPVWIFHGEKDPAVPPSGPNGWDARNRGGRDMAALIPGSKYTEFAGADHFIWDRVYADPEFWSWLFSQSR